MSPAPSPSWYDLLGVAPDAPADQIRGAWRAAISDLDPTDRRFTVLNRAAEVLLDPQARAAYDAELAAQAPGPASESAVAAEPAVPARKAPAAGLATVPGWLLAAVGVLTLALVAVTAVVWMKEPSAGAVESRTRAAQAAAERAVVPILSYDAGDIEGSKAAAQQYLTGAYRTEYDKLFDGIIAQNAPSTGTVLEADLVRSSIVRSGEGRVEVFVLVNQARTNKRFKEPQVYKNWVTITMENVDGDWLVAGMDT